MIQAFKSAVTGKNKKEKDIISEDESEISENYTNEEDEDEEENEDSSDKGPVRIPLYDTKLTIADSEKNALLKSFCEMRNELIFCDIVFLCQGVLFRAHRVIVSSWSRWLRALLFAGSDDEVVTVDVLSPDSFAAVLNYMYGLPLIFSIENAESIIKVVRRLEMPELEKQCWRFLMMAIDADNCEILHEIADRYDCPPLKLTAWRILQESVPSYNNNPKLMFDIHTEGGSTSHDFIGNGLTGPGEGESEDDDDDYDDYDDNRVSIFNYKQKRNNDDDDEDDESTKISGDDRSSIASSVYPHPKDLPENSTAADFVRAWGCHLQKVYAECKPNDADAYELPDDLYNTNYAAPTRNNYGNNRPRPVADIDWKGELKRFYLSINLPEKIPSLNSILDTWAGKEDQMLSSLLVKYRKIIPKDVYLHFDQLHTLVETQTESSFIHPN